MPKRKNASGREKRIWKAVCACGNVATYIQSNLVKGTTRSCGCLQKEFCTKWPTNGDLYKLDLRNRWLGMKSRCEKTHDKKYPLYGGRGISVCKRWQDFTNFYHDMVESYRPGLSIDRIDGDGGYSPSNCRWADAITQNRNRRTSVLVHGECVTVICKRMNVNYDTLRKLRRRFPSEDIDVLFDSLVKS